VDVLVEEQLVTTLKVDSFLAGYILLHRAVCSRAGPFLFALRLTQKFAHFYGRRARPST
jgi:hypothetical protein